MDDYGDDFVTLRAPLQSLQQKQTPRTSSRPALSEWKDDDFEAMGGGLDTATFQDCDATVKRNTLPSLPTDGLGNFSDDFEDEFADDIGTLRARRPVLPPPADADFFFSDSSQNSRGSPGRLSVSSASSLSTVPPVWDDDDDFDIGGDVDLAERFQTLKQRAANEAAQRALRERSSPRKKASVRFRDAVDTADIATELADLDLDISAKNMGTVNKNVRFGAPKLPILLQNQTQPNQPHLRGSRSIAQLGPDMRASGSLRPARSMMNLSPLKHAQARSNTVQRPLTAYREPPSRPRSRHKIPNLIRNTGDLAHQERNGMVLNPATGMWEGNDTDALRFDTSIDLEGVARPQLIRHLPPLPMSQQNGMVFDAKNLCWTYANNNDYDDPFAGMEDLRPTRSVTGTSTTSFGSSVSRPAFSGREVFDVSTELRLAWKREDDRIMRKFGRWIGGAKERADMFSDANCLYEMFRAP